MPQKYLQHVTAVLLVDPHQYGRCDDVSGVSRHMKNP